MRAEPFVKWAGGKRQLIAILLQNSPSEWKTYYEPFGGGLALFLELFYRYPNRKFVISDANPELSNAYNVIKKDVEGLIKDLKRRKRLYFASPEQYFYQARAENPISDIGKASRFIFLNRTCFNGLYRVNSKGEFNVPWGKYTNPLICNELNLREVSRVLNFPNVTWHGTSNYKTILLLVKKGDFIYCDPPYEPLTETANFTSYTASGFTFQDQTDLANEMEKLRQKDVSILVSNSNVQRIKDLYPNFEIQEIKANRNINCKGNSRKGTTELLISSIKKKEKTKQTTF